MAVAALSGLLAPAFEEGGAGLVIAGLAGGIAFLVVAKHYLGADASFMGRSGPGARASALIFFVLFLHSLPEGLAVGTAFASNRSGLSLFVIVAIAIQNVPEGTSVAIPMQEAGFGAGRQFWAAVATSAPQPVGAMAAFFAVEEMSGLLPFSFSFAAGAMLALVAMEILPKAYSRGRPWNPSVGFAAGTVLMLALGIALGV
jgi:ZIP family zinc transporter